MKVLIKNAGSELILLKMSDQVSREYKLREEI